MEQRKKFNIRISQDERKLIQKMADKYCEGNFSEWIRFAAMNLNPTKEQIKKLKES